MEWLTTTFSVILLFLLRVLIPIAITMSTPARAVFGMKAAREPTVNTVIKTMRPLNTPATV